MRKRRLLTLMLVLLVGSLSMMAQSKLVVHQTDGSSKQFDIASIKKMLVSPQTFSVFTQDENAIAVAGIQSIKFSLEGSGISNAVVGNDIALQRNGDILTNDGKNYIIESGLKAGDRVQLYNVNGQMTGNIDGKLLNLSTLNRGVYILKINNKTIKFAN